MTDKRALLAWYPRYPRDYLTKTRELTMIEHGAYTLLLDHYYMTGHPLPADRMQLHRICMAVSTEEQAAIDTVIRKFFTRKEVEGGVVYVMNRVEEEVAKRAKISAGRRAAARSRWNGTPKKGKQVDMQMHNHVDMQGGMQTPMQTACETDAKSHASTQYTDKSKNHPLRDGSASDANASANAQGDRKARKTTFPADFEITPAMRDWAKQRAPAVDLNRETELFRNYHTAKGQQYVNWEAAWRNWIIKAVEIATERRQRDKGAQGGADWREAWKGGEPEVDWREAGQ